MLFNLQIFEVFLAIVLFLISNLTVMVGEHTLYGFNSFKFIETCLMAQHMVSLG